MWWHIHFDSIIVHLFFFQEEMKTEVQTDNVRCVLVYQTLNY